ncbi:MAG: 30S ribosomal protein S9 [Planctomycetes bacterium]|nr:30S ribosomal protein S9 [Planctomycetota bacterium]
MHDTMDENETTVVEAAEPAPRRVKKAPPAGEVWGTGRRKTSVARVRLRRGDGKIVVNRKPFGEYFSLLQDRNRVEEALKLLGAREKVDVLCSVKGGGPTGQAGAIAMGMARALRKYDAGYDDALRTSGLLTRDSRMKERKKYGRRGARRGFQFSKR